jgi:hypothetical protein
MARLRPDEVRASVRARSAAAAARQGLPGKAAPSRAAAVPGRWLTACSPNSMPSAATADSASLATTSGSASRTRYHRIPRLMRWPNDQDASDLLVGRYQVATQACTGDRLPGSPNRGRGDVSPGTRGGPAWGGHSRRAQARSPRRKIAFGMLAVTTSLTARHPNINFMTCPCRLPSAHSC